MVAKKAAAKKTAVKPTGMVTVKVKSFRDIPVVHGNVFFSAGKLKHPDTLVVTADEALACDLVEIVSEEEVEDEFLS